MQCKPTAARPRNLLHDHPLLRKGGIHGKSRKAERRDGKVALRREWGPQNVLAQNAVPTTFAA